MRQGKLKYVFPGSNTPKGFHSYYKEGLKGMQHIFILKGSAGCGKSTMMRKIGNAMLERGYDVEFWQCSSDNDSLDGILVPAVGIAIIDGTSPHIVDPVYPGAVDEIVNLGNHWDDEYLRDNKKDIIQITDEISDFFTKCYDLLAKAGIKRKEWESIYLKHINHDRIATESDRLIDEIFCRKSPPTRHLFASAVTPKGFVSFADNITKHYKRRYILQGAPGCGKSLVLEKIAATAEARGHMMEVYHNTFEPDRIELVLLPDLSVALWDLSFDYKIELKEEDILIDGLKLLEEIPTDMDLEDELIEDFQDLVSKASQQVAQAKDRHDDLEAIYNKAMDFEAVDKTGTDLFNKILNLIAKEED